MGPVKYKKQDLLDRYEELPQDTVHWYFSSFPIFVKALGRNKHSLSVLILYLFMRVELAQLNLLYFLMIEKCNLDRDVVKEQLNKLRINRDDFVCLYEILVKKPIHPHTDNIIREAQEDRNTIIHSKDLGIKVKDKEKAIMSIFEYSVLLNNQVYEDLNFEFEPFGKKDEFKSKGKPSNAEDSKNTINKIFTALRKLKKEKQRQKEIARQREAARQREVAREKRKEKP